MKSLAVPLRNNEIQSNYENYRAVNEPECAVGGALALVLRASRWAGVAPLRVRAAVRDVWLVSVSPPLAVLQRLFITALNIAALVALILDYREDVNRRIRVGSSDVEASVWIFDLALAHVIASIAAYWGPTRMKSLIRTLKQLQQINSDLKNDPSTKHEKIGTITVSCMLILSITTQVVENFTKIQQLISKGLNWPIMAIYNAFYVANVLGLLAVLQWSFTAVAVHATATALNRHLGRMQHESIFTLDEQVQSMIRHLALTHEHIGEVIEQMNAANGVMIIAVLMATFVRLVVTPYYLLSWLNSNEGFLKTILIQFSWSIMHIFTLLLTIEPCHWTQEQRETTKYLLSRLIVRFAPTTSLLSQELHQFAKQAMLVDVKFTPLGIYTLGRPLTAAMFGGVATYLLILLQFQTISDDD